MAKLRSQLKRLALAGAAAIGLAAPAGAQGFNWTGFYAGVNAGYAWGDVDTGSQISCQGTGVGCPVTNPANLAIINSSAAGSYAMGGFTGGVQAGHNWQNGSAVLGVELDFNAFDLSGSRSAPARNVTNTGTLTPSTSLETDWLFTLRGRLGWAVAPTVLLYATGGLAMTDARLENQYSDTALASGGSSSKQPLLGWALGGGVEWALDRNWTVKAEYLYVDFGSLSTTASVNNPSLPGAVNTNILATTSDLNAQIARAGINYKF